MPRKTPPSGRRRFLTYVGTAGAVALAGCLAGDDDDETTDSPTESSTASPPDDSIESPTDEPPAAFDLRIVHDTHFHGKIGDPDDDVNAATYFGLASSLLEDAENGYALGNGDDLHMSVESSVFEGGHMVDVLNASPISYDAYGNHEFDDGPESLRENVADSEFRWLSANVLDVESGDAFAAEEGAARYAIEEVEGVRIGFTGLAPADTPEVTTVGEDVEVLDPADAARDVVADLREEGADLIVLLSHLANTVAIDLAEEVDGIDVVVGDHASSVEEEPLEVGGTLLSFVGDEFDFLGQLDLRVENGDLADYDFTLHDLEEAVEAGDAEPDEEIRTLIEDYDGRLDDELGEVIGETAVELDVRRETVRRRETPFANYIADALREAEGADVYLQNGGSIRSDQVYEPGEITRRMVVDVLPFGGSNVVVELSGVALEEAIEHGVSTVEELHGRFPQVSGMSYAYDPDAEPGERVTEIRVAGEPLDPQETFEAGVSDFIAGGGDGYDVIAEADVVRSAAEGADIVTTVTEAIEEDGTIAPEEEGRIEVIDSGSESLRPLGLF